ncbi:hypothetical protein QOT17_012131 [Balamuthia mandrillaris]
MVRAVLFLLLTASLLAVGLAQYQNLYDTLCPDGPDSLHPACDIRNRNILNGCNFGYGCDGTVDRDHAGEALEHFRLYYFLMQFKGLNMREFIDGYASFIPHPDLNDLATTLAVRSYEQQVDEYCFPEESQSSDWGFEGIDTAGLCETRVPPFLTRREPRGMYRRDITELGSTELIEIMTLASRLFLGNFTTRETGQNPQNKYLGNPPISIGSVNLLTGSGDSLLGAWRNLLRRHEIPLRNTRHNWFGVGLVRSAEPDLPVEVKRVHIGVVLVHACHSADPNYDVSVIKSCHDISFDDPGLSLCGNHKTPFVGLSENSIDDKLFPFPAFLGTDSGDVDNVPLICGTMKLDPVNPLPAPFPNFQGCGYVSFDLSTGEFDLHVEHDIPEFIWSEAPTHQVDVGTTGEYEFDGLVHLPFAVRNRAVEVIAMGLFNNNGSNSLASAQVGIWDRNFPRENPDVQNATLFQFIPYSFVTGADTPSGNYDQYGSNFYELPSSFLLGPGRYLIQSSMPDPGDAIAYATGACVNGGDWDVRKETPNYLQFPERAKVECCQGAIGSCSSASSCGAACLEDIGQASDSVVVGAYVSTNIANRPDRWTAGTASVQIRGALGAKLVVLSNDGIETSVETVATFPQGSTYSTTINASFIVCDDSDPSCEFSFVDFVNLMAGIAGGDVLWLAVPSGGYPEAEIAGRIDFGGGCGLDASNLTAVCCPTYDQGGVTYPRSSLVGFIPPEDWTEYTIELSLDGGEFFSVQIIPDGPTRRSTRGGVLPDGLGSGSGSDDEEEVVGPYVITPTTLEGGFNQFVVQVPPGQAIVIIIEDLSGTGFSGGGFLSILDEEGDELVLLDGDAWTNFQLIINAEGDIVSASFS